MPLYAALIAGLISIILWYINKRKEQNIVDRLHREKIYKALIENLPGFYQGTHLKPEEIIEHKDKFLNHFALMSLYCPDNIYKKAKEFLYSVKKDSLTAERREDTIRELILLMRKDLTEGLRVKPTKLSINDIVFFKP